MSSHRQHNESGIVSTGQADDLLVPERVTAACGLRVEYHATIDSTQVRAHQLSRECDATSLPVVIVAEEQTAGRGRGSNRWWTGRGSLAFSLLFDPAAWTLPAHPVPQRSLAVGAAIVATVQPLLNEYEVGLHWPNDVFAAGQKLAGVLIDVVPSGRHIIGIGLNVNNTFDMAPPEVRQRATSLSDLIGRMFDRTALLGQLLANVRLALIESASDPNGYGQRFEYLCLQRGRELTVDIAGRRTTGRCLTIDPDGALVLETETGTQRVYSGSLVHFGAT
jgi:BirA family transcriptional regulator, biotin operon repressor / biotin---[acetyl-CoA-carboxylase] ligase